VKNICFKSWHFIKKCSKLQVLLWLIIRPPQTVAVTIIRSLQKFTPMVTTDISQLTAECNTWREQMRNYREEITNLKDQLRKIALKVTRYDQLQDVEHYENQFHIQLINIHDLKHSIKVHDYKTTLARVDNNGRVNHTTIAEHQHLFSEYRRLQSLLDELKDRFHQFISKLN